MTANGALVKAPHFCAKNTGTESVPVICLFGAIVGSVGLRCAAVAAEKLCDGHKFIIAFQHLFDSVDGAVYGGAVQVMHQYDGTVGAADDGTVNFVGVTVFPVTGIH